MDDLVVADADAYVAKAIALGRDRAERRSVATRIEAARDSIFGRDEPLAALADFLDRAGQGC
jgi:predicted O-linked N-acetylglucosamine transferase (SPINDLY family)